MSKRENFERLLANRKDRFLAITKGIGKLSNTSAYDYDNLIVMEAFIEMQDALDEALRQFMRTKRWRENGWPQVYPYGIGEYPPPDNSDAPSVFDPNETDQSAIDEIDAEVIELQKVTINHMQATIDRLQSKLDEGKRK